MCHDMTFRPHQSLFCCGHRTCVAVKVFRRQVLEQPGRRLKDAGDTIPTFTRAWYCFGLNWFGAADTAQMRASDTHLMAPLHLTAPLCE